MNKVLKNIATLEAAFLKVVEAFKSSLGSTVVLDNVAKDHTAFDDFAALAHADGGYFPSLHKAPLDDYNENEVVTLANGRKLTRKMQYAELDLLALAYNMAQEARGDNRRAFRS